MAQSFLQQLIPTMEEAVMLTVPLSILLAIVLPLKSAAYKNMLVKMLKWGFFLSLFMAMVKTGTRQAVSREIFDAMAIVIALVAEIFLLFVLVGGKRENELPNATKRFFGWAVGGITLALFLWHGMEIWLMPVISVNAAEGNYFTVAMLVKIVGWLTGLCLGFLSGFLVYKASAALNHKRLVFVFAVQMAATIFGEAIFLLQVLLARQVLSSETLLAIMAPLIDHQSWLIFVVFFVTFFVPVTLFLQPRPEKTAEENPAEYRKVLSQALHKRRWGTAVVGVLAVLVCLSSFGSAYANQKESLVPAVPVEAENGTVGIALEEVADGHLHRYGYRAQDGTTVRIIIIQKGGSAYGVGLDACEVCGATGYYEKDGQVICRLCNVMMNKATIGMPGGCNPVPVAHKIENGKVSIDAETLEEARRWFR